MTQAAKLDRSSAEMPAQRVSEEDFRFLCRDDLSEDEASIQNKIARDIRDLRRAWPGNMDRAIEVVEGLRQVWTLKRDFSSFASKHMFWDDRLGAAEDILSALRAANAAKYFGDAVKISCSEEMSRLKHALRDAEAAVADMRERCVEVCYNAALFEEDAAFVMRVEACVRSAREIGHVVELQVDTVDRLLARRAAPPALESSK